MSERISKRVMESKPKQVPTMGGGSSRSPSPEEMRALAMDVPVERFQKIVEGAAALQDMALAHEIAIDGSFKLKPHTPPENSIEKAVVENLKRAFWDILKQELDSDPPKYAQSLRLLEDVKLGLCNAILPRHKKLLQNINDILDTTIIKQQAEAGVLDFKAYSKYVLEVMGKMCATARDERIKELLECDDVVETFKGILELLDVMRLDLANASIQLARPDFITHSIQFQKDKFNEFLKSREGHEDCFVDTRKWLMRHAGTEDKPRSKEQVLNNAYLEFIDWDDANPFPETLIFDQGRLLELRSRVMRLIACATTLVVASGSSVALKGVASHQAILHEDISTLIKSVVSLADLKETLPSVADQIVKQINTSLDTHGKPTLTQDEETTVKGQILQVANPNHTVRLLLKQRLIDYFKLCLESTRGPIGIQIPAGWVVWGSDLLPLAAGFCRLTIHNRSVFGEHYFKLIEQNFIE